jgi:hypothetical protein
MLEAAAACWSGQAPVLALQLRGTALQCTLPHDHTFPVCACLVLGAHRKSEHAHCLLGGVVWFNSLGALSTFARALQWIRVQMGAAQWRTGVDPYIMGNMCLPKPGEHRVWCASKA